MYKQFVHLKTGCLSRFSYFRREKELWKSNITTKTLISSYTVVIDIIGFLSHKLSQIIEKNLHQARKTQSLYFQ